MNANELRRWARVARAVAGESTCTRSNVGAVIVSADGGRVLGLGYNDIPGGSCGAGGCPRGRRTYAEQPPGGDYSDCAGTHAEIAAMDMAEENVGSIPAGSWIIVTRRPCEGCSEAILESGMLLTYAEEGT